MDRRPQLLIELRQPSRPTECVELPWPPKPGLIRAKLAGVEATIDVGSTPSAATIRVTAQPPAPAEMCIALRCKADGATLFSWFGAETKEAVYRQSPHDPGDHRIGQMLRQPVPMGGAELGSSRIIAVADHPAACGNYCTQVFEPAEHAFCLTTGDDGRTPNFEGKRFAPHFHRAAPGEPHIMDFILFESPPADLPRTRTLVLCAIADRWGQSSSRFHAIMYAINYMYYFANESGHSDYCVVPGIEYSNKQYSRDSFWQTMILPPEMEIQSYRHEAHLRAKGAERPLFLIIRSYRCVRAGGKADLEAASDALAYVEARTHDGMYHAGEGFDKRDFQSWYDLCAFDSDDVITYNQGLLAVALQCAREIGLKTATEPALAARRYNEMFRQDLGFYPLSRKKGFLAVDPLAGEVLSKLYFDRLLLPSPRVRRHYDRLMAVARTESGFKVTCAPDGSYLTGEDYSTADWRSPLHDFAPGSYQRGGSWFLYDMLCLLGCYLHGCPGAEDQVIWRTAIEIQRGGTTHETIDTVTGAPGKTSYGWNAAIWSMWNEFMRRGWASSRYFDVIEKFLA
jgi:hypothetical protein